MNFLETITTPLTVATSVATDSTGFDFLDIIAVLLTLASLFAYINHRWIKLPITIGIMLISLICSLVMIAIGSFYPYLLFAGALHVNMTELKKQSGIVAIMATIGVTLTTFAVGTIAYYIFSMLGVQIQYSWCLVFGALIAPTDPVAVLGILKTAGAPKSLETKITGESRSRLFT